MGRTSRDEARRWAGEAVRSVYRFDVRTPEEYEAGHVPGFRSAPGGQLVQETDMFAPVRGARVILADNDGVRANMSASWLAQMNVEVYVVDGLSAADFGEKGAAPPARYAPTPPAVDEIAPAELRHAAASAGHGRARFHEQRELCEAAYSGRVVRDSRAPRRCVAQVAGCATLCRDVRQQPACALCRARAGGV